MRITRNEIIVDIGEEKKLVVKGDYTYLGIFKENELKIGIVVNKGMFMSGHFFKEEFKGHFIKFGKCMLCGSKPRNGKMNELTSFSPLTGLFEYKSDSGECYTWPAPFKSITNIDESTSFGVIAGFKGSECVIHTGLFTKQEILIQGLKTNCENIQNGTFEKGKLVSGTRIMNGVLESGEFDNEEKIVSGIVMDYINHTYIKYGEFVDSKIRKGWVYRKDLKNPNMCVVSHGNFDQDEVCL